MLFLPTKKNAVKIILLRSSDVINVFIKTEEKLKAINLEIKKITEEKEQEIVQLQNDIQILDYQKNHNKSIITKIQNLF